MSFFVACKLLSTSTTVFPTFTHNWYWSSRLIFLIGSKWWSLMDWWASCSTSIFTGSQTVSIYRTVKLKGFIIILTSACRNFWCWAWLINGRILFVRKQFEIFFIKKDIISFCGNCCHRLNGFVNELIFVSFNKRRYDVTNIHWVIFSWMLFTGLLSSFFAIWNIIIRFFIRSVNKWASLTLFVFLFRRFYLFFVFRKSLIFCYEIVLNRLGFRRRWCNRFWDLLNQLSLTTEFNFHQVIKSSGMIMTIIDDICSGLNGINIIQLLHIFYDLFIGFDNILSNNDTLWFIPVTC